MGRLALHALQASFFMYMILPYRYGISVAFFWKNYEFRWIFCESRTDTAGRPLHPHLCENFNRDPAGAV